MTKTKRVPAEMQLDVTLYTEDGGTPLIGAARDAVIVRLMEKFGGVQAPGIGTVIIPVLEENGITVQLWIHEWE